MAGRTRVLVSHSNLIALCAHQVFSLENGQLEVAAMSPHLVQGQLLPENCQVRDAATSLQDAGLASVDNSQVGKSENGRQSITQTMRVKPVDTPENMLIADSSFSAFIKSFAVGTGGMWYGLGNLLTLLGECGVTEAGVWVLALYADRSVHDDDIDHGFYVGLYAASYLGELIFSVGRSILQLFGTQKQYNEIQKSLLQRVMVADITFFENTLVSGIVQLFSGHLQSCDAISVQQVVLVLHIIMRFLFE